MIAWGREKRQATKQVNYNERNLWEKSMKETSSENAPKRKKTARANNAKKIKISRNQRSKSASRSSNRASNKRSTSSKSSKTQKVNKKNYDYDQNEDDYYDNEEESDSESSKSANEYYSENSSYDENSEDEEESSYDESDDTSILSITHRKIKPVKFFEIEKKKRPVKKNKKTSKSNSKSKNKKVNSRSKSNKNKKPTNNRNKKQIREYSSSDKSDYASESESESEEDVVQEILGILDTGSEEQEKTLQKDESGTTTTDDETQETKYYVKFKERSYQQSQYLTKQEILQYNGGDKALKQFIRSKPADISDMAPSLSIPNLLVTDETSINSDWYEIDRIIDDANDHNHKEYLVKWKSQDYTDSTWEFVENIKEKSKIKEYEERLQRSNPIKFSSRYHRPGPDKFEELKEPPESKINTNLRDYQLAGLNWLRNCWYNRKNNILADEMGLGKTAQIVCLLNDLNINEGLSGPFLVVAPLSTLAHWKLEFERWTDLNCIVFHGDKENRDKIIECEINYYDDDGKQIKDRVGFDVMVTNYEIFRSDKPAKIISKIQWRYLVVDEAHKMKNSKSAIFRILKNLEFDHCTLLTGTPIQNDMSELWSLLNFVDPKHYNDLDSFMEKYGDMKNSSQIQEVQKIIRPILLRRKKGDVEKDILPKDETIIEVELTRTQKQFYKAFLDENAPQLLQKMTSSRNYPSLKNLMMQLRKVCNHPYLIVGAEKSIFDETKRKNISLNLSKKEIRLKSLIESSGKMILIDKLLPKLRQENHKVLIFSQMVKILDILQNYLNYKGYTYVRLDGTFSESDRQQSIERFNNDSDCFIFLLSTKAGGIGINLTAADTVIIYDSDWNPQNDIQAEARCHRIGQTSMVKVYRLITRNTYESEMFVRASKKLALDHVVLDGGCLDDQSMNASEMEKILRRGAYSLFNDSKDDNDAEIDQFCADDIDHILSSRSRRVQEDVVAGGGSVFSNVTFNATNDDLDINSVDFWSQVFQNEGGIDKSSGNQFYGQRKRNELLHLNLVQVRKMIQFIIDKGYPHSLSDNDNEIAHAVLQIAFSLSNMKNNRNVDIITFYLRGQRLLKNHQNSDDNEDNDDDSNSDDSEQENFDLKDPMKVYGDEVVYVAGESADKIINRVIFFYKLKECLYQIQGDGFIWPEIKPLWDSPIKEYALMVGVYRYGLSDIAQIYEDETLGLEHSKVLKKKQIESRLDQLITKIQKQFITKQNENEKQKNENENEEEDNIDDDLPLFEIPDKFEPMIPTEWGREHSNIFEKNLLTDKEVNAIIQVVLEFGIPIDYDSDDNENQIDSNKIIKLASPALENINPDVVKSFIEKLLFVVNRIQDDDDNDDDNSDTENQKKSKSDTEIDLSDFPELSKLSATRIRHLKQSILIMSEVYQFIYSFSIHPDKEQYLTAVKSNSQFPPWWNIQCDQSLIDSFSKYGQNFVYSMLADENYPFYANLSEEQKEIVKKNALQEAEKGKPNPFDEENLSDLKVLFSRRSRVPRVLAFIKHINKHYERRKKEKKQHSHHNHSSSIKENDGEIIGKLNQAEKDKYLKKEMIIGTNLEEVVYNLRNPQASTRLPYPADHYLSSKRLYSMKYPNAFGLDILVRKRNIRIMSFGEHRSEKQFTTKTGNCSLNPGFVSFRKYPVLASPVFEQRWYICEIIELNGDPFFRITDIDSPQFTFTEHDIVKLFTLFFAYLRQRFLTEYKCKLDGIQTKKEFSDDEILQIFNGLDRKDQKVAPLEVTKRSKCYTIFGLNEREDSNNSDDEPNSKSLELSENSASVDKTNNSLLDGLIPINFNIPLYDVSLFPQLKDLKKD